MAGYSLNTTATLMCPHGGTVQTISTNSRASAAAAPIACADDSFVIAGCPFQIGGAPSPCVRVQWLAADCRVRVGGSATLSQSCAGLCLNGAGLAQGAVVVVSTQSRVRSQ